MAPEIFRGEPATPLTDQFSFCVATWEALYGARPFAGDSLVELRDAIGRGTLPPPPPDSAVPARIRRALARGLAADPLARFPSMPALLDALLADPGARVRRRVILGAGLAVAVAAGAIAVIALGAGDDKPSCRFDAARFAGAWDPSRRARVETALTAAGAGASFPAVAAALDGYQTRWLATGQEACEATHVRGVQTAEVLDSRMACLDRGRLAMGELTQRFADGNRDLIHGAAAAVYGLPDPAGCTVADARATILPVQPAARAAVERARATLTHAWSLYVAGDSAGATAGIDETLAAIKPYDYPTLVSEALLLRARVDVNRGDDAAAVAALYEALTAAERAHRDTLIAEIWIQLVETTGAQQHKFDVAESSARAADAVLARIEGSDALRLRYAYTYGGLLLAQGKLAPARERLTAALDLAIAAGRPGDIALCRVALCDVQQQLGDAAAARAQCTEGIALLEAAFGPADARLATALNTAGALELAAGDAPAAQKLFARSIAAFEAAGNAELQVGYALAVSNLGTAARRQGDDARAEAQYGRARDLFAAHHPEHPQRNVPLQGLAILATARGDYPEAIESHRGLRELAEKTYGHDSPAADIAAYNLADTYRAAKDAAHATEIFDELIARLDGRPASWQVLGYSLEGSAELAASRGDRARARALLARAITVLADHDPGTAGELRTRLAGLK